MGVYYEKDRSRWRARYYYNGKQLHVGVYKTELAAKRGLNKFIQSLEEPKQKRNWLSRIFG